MIDWQPIETAPKDGTRFLASAVGWKTVWETHWLDSRPIAGGYPGFSRTMFNDTSSSNFQPTHWMPLPEPPEAP